MTSRNRRYHWCSKPESVIGPSNGKVISESHSPACLFDGCSEPHCTIGGLGMARSPAGLRRVESLPDGESDDLHDMGVRHDIDVPLAHVPGALEGCPTASAKPRARRGPENHEQPVCALAGQEACEVGQTPTRAQFRNSAVKGVREHTHPSPGSPRTGTPFPGDPAKTAGRKRSPDLLRRDGDTVPVPSPGHSGGVMPTATQITAGPTHPVPPYTTTAPLGDPRDRAYWPGVERCV